jgi:hypothetical protein
VLKTEEESEEDGDFIVETVEWCFIIFVFPVQGPDVGCDEVDIILWLLLIFGIL